MNLEIESDINPSKLQKTAAEGTAGKPGFSEFREEAATTNEDVAGPATNQGDFIETVFRAYRQLFHVPHCFQLDSFRPAMRGPGVEESASGAADGLIRIGDFIHLIIVLRCRTGPVKLFRRSGS